MPCFHPWEAWPKAPPDRGVTTNRALSYEGAVSLKLPCGQCIGCRKDKSEDWATRIMHEASLHRDNCFITLTFSDLWLPASYSVAVRDIQLWNKRFRKLVAPVRTRFFACGEYGDINLRPHYHVIVFGWAPTDGKPWRSTPSGFVVHRSALLERSWPFGHVEVGGVSHASAAYVARYCLKKINGKLASTHYQRVHPLTGEVVRVRPEFITLSNKPGVGYGWFERFAHSDAFPKDYLHVDGKRRSVPKYYFRKYKEKEALDRLALGSAKIIANRKRLAKRHEANNTPDRLAVREEVLGRRAAQLKRSI